MDSQSPPESKVKVGRLRRSGNEAGDSGGSHPWPGIWWNGYQIQVYPLFSKLFNLGNVFETLYFPTSISQFLKFPYFWNVENNRAVSSTEKAWYHSLILSWLYNVYPTNLAIIAQAWILPIVIIADSQKGESHRLLDRWHWAAPAQAVDEATFLKLITSNIRK